jgi:Carboxypeptidase regulatory-like domain
MSRRRSDWIRAGWIRAAICVLSAGFAVYAPAQTTQGLISGRLVDSVTGRGVGGASISATGSTEAKATSDPSGYYYLPLLSPASYRVRVTASSYQTQEIQELTLAVAARLDIDFKLRPLNDVWEAGQYNSVFLPGSKTIVTFFGPDVDPSRSGSFEAQKGRTGALESTVSDVIDGGQLAGLPLLGRDVYTILVTEPGVTSDAATARGLGLSINGQRPSESNFLLDGLENNNYLITGPLVTVAPEAIQEYRISTNNFSAEYGRTSGFLANAITRMGTNQFHGTGYFYFKNEKLDANGFQENRLGFARRQDKQWQPGFVLTGPILKDRLVFSASYEYFRSTSVTDPFPFTLPNTPVFLNTLTFEGQQSYALLKKYPGPSFTSPAVFGTLLLAAPVEFDRHLAVGRLDYSTPNGKNRVMGRLLVSRVTEPDFIWTPYTDFISALNQNTWAAGGSYQRQIRPNLLNEFRASVTSDDLHWNRPHPEVPTLAATLTSQPGSAVVTLPGSPAYYEYKNVNDSQEFLDNMLWSRGRHLFTGGVGILFRSSDGYLTAGRDGQYRFNSLFNFAQDRPSALSVTVSRTGLPTLTQPGFDRTFGYRQYFLFAQDTFKITSRLTVNYGFRYEIFGGPRNTGSSKDLLVQLGPGATLPAQLTGATLVSQTGNGAQQLFGTDTKDISVRAGISYDLFGNAKTVVRGAYGTFYDRPYDNLWENLRNNTGILPSFDFTDPVTQVPPQRNFLAPIPQVLAGLPGATAVPQIFFPELTMIDPNLENGYVKSVFAGVQQRISNSMTAEVNMLGAYGRNLITTDVINRDFSTTNTKPNGRYNPALPNINYRTGEGTSDYNALTAVLRYRSSRGYFQAAYTLSHAIDVQSDALAGDFFSLTFASVVSSAGSTSGRATYSQQFNPAPDRASADFDQRQNFVVHGYWTPAPVLADRKIGLLLRDWNFGGLAAIRSGFPYTVYGTSNVVTGGGLIFNNRANLLNPGAAVVSPATPIAGGEQLLNPAAFGNAAPSTLGTVGRNAFTGPGFYNLDLAVGRSFPLRWLGEGALVNFRADMFNVLNHANLGNPDSLLASPTFGQATFGRQGSQKKGFPALSPLNETPRQIQLSVRLQF